MFTPEQYRAKAAQYTELARAGNAPDEVREFQKMGRSFTALADNEQWLADNHDKAVHAPERRGVSEEAAGGAYPAMPPGSADHAVEHVTGRRHHGRTDNMVDRPSPAISAPLTR
jgi:hypothetical protein